LKRCAGEWGRRWYLAEKKATTKDTKIHEGKPGITEVVPEIVKRT